jgi:hypothetical protein
MSESIADEDSAAGSVERPNRLSAFDAGPASRVGKIEENE